MVGFSVCFLFCCCGVLFFCFVLFCFFSKGHFEVKGTINFSVLADVNGQEKAEREAVAGECYASLPSFTIFIRLARKHVPNPVTFHGQLQLPQNLCKMKIALKFLDFLI